MAAGLDLLPLPRVERVPLKHPPLMLALCQLQFTPVLGVVDTAFVAPFHDAIRETYPFPNRVADVGLQVQFGQGMLLNTQPMPPSQHWEFNDLTVTWKVVLTSTSVSLESRTYTSFDDFLDRFDALVDALSRHIRPPLGTRIGLRYINELRPRGKEWADVISRELLGPLTVPAFQAHAERVVSLQQIALRYEGNQGITINQGLVPDGTTVLLRPGEQAPQGPFYLLDFDVFHEFPLPNGLLIKAPEVRDYVKSYHDLIYRAFRWSITDEYLATLKGE